MIDTPIHSKSKKSYNLRIRQEFCQPQIGRKVRILLMYLPGKKNIMIYIQTCNIHLTPDNSNLQGKSKKVRVIGSSSYRELEENSRE